MEMHIENSAKAAWAQIYPNDPHAALRAEYIRQRDSLPCELGFYLWECDWIDTALGFTPLQCAPEFNEYMLYRCTDISCYVSKDGEPAIRMLRTEAQKLQSELVDKAGWFDPFGFNWVTPMEFSNAGIYTYKLKSAKVVLLADVPVGVAVKHKQTNEILILRASSHDEFSLIRAEKLDNQGEAGTHNYRAASLELAPAADQPWLNWRGGDCPVPEGVIVEVTVRASNRVIREGTSPYMRWAHVKIDSATDIIEYRVIGIAEGYKIEGSK